MAKATQVFLFLNLILGAVILTFGILVFNDRGVVKARALLLEQNAIAVSRSLNWGGQVEWEGPDERKLTPFTVPQPTIPEALTDLETNLNELARFATQRVAQLNQRYAELITTRNTLADTEERLATRKRELAAARTQIGNLEQNLASTQNELREVNRNIDTLRGEKTTLERRIEETNNEITDVNNKIAGDEVTLEKVTADRDRTIRDYERCRIGAAGGTKNVRIRGTSARVMAVNNDWNYVVIDRGAAHSLEPFTEALIHRGNQFVGSVTVMRVEDRYSVAQVTTLRDGVTLQPGDTLFF